MARPKKDKTATYRAFNLKLNTETDADIIKALESKENRQGWIKSLIRRETKREPK